MIDYLSVGGEQRVLELSQLVDSLYNELKMTAELVQKQSEHIKKLKERIRKGKTNKAKVYMSPCFGQCFV